MLVQWGELLLFGVRMRLRADVVTTGTLCCAAPLRECSSMPGR